MLGIEESSLFGVLDTPSPFGCVDSKNAQCVLQWAIVLATEEALVCQRAEAAEEQGAKAKKAGASKGKVGVDASRLLLVKDWTSTK